MKFSGLILSLTVVGFCFASMRGETINCTPGTLSELLGNPGSKIESLTITGEIDVRDLSALADLSIFIDNLTLTKATIAEYSPQGADKAERCRYEANTLPPMIFADTRFNSVMLPSSLRVIGSGAFAGSAIRTIEIPQGVTTIHDMAFSGCRNLSTIQLPASVRTIGEQTFRGCTSLANASLENTAVETIPYQAFAGCTALASISLPSTVRYVADEAFLDTAPSHTANIIPASAKVGNYVFAHNANASVVCCFEGCLPEGSYFASPGVLGIAGSPEEFGTLSLADTGVQLSVSNLECAYCIKPYALANTKSTEISLGRDTQYLDSHALSGMSELKKIFVHALGDNVIPVHPEAFAWIEPADIKLLVDSESCIAAWKADPLWGSFQIECIGESSVVSDALSSEISIRFEGEFLIVTAPEEILSVNAYSASGRLLLSAEPNSDIFETDTSAIDETLWIVSVDTPTLHTAVKLIRP